MSVVRQQVTIVTVSDDESGQRIDNFLLARLKDLPKSRVYRLVRKGEVRVNKGRIKPEYRIKAGDQIRIPPIIVRESKPDLSLSTLPDSLQSILHNAVLFEDDHWLIIDKPPNLAVHGGSGQSFGLIEALRIMRDDCHFLELCHRLDKDTSGCIVIAKKRSSLKRFHAALRDKILVKRYLALVIGRWPKAIDAINVPLEKNVLQSGERMVFAHADGKISKTLFSICDKFEKYTLVEAQPVTGRTHQIRVHAKTAGYPIVGDVKYGNDEVNKVFRSKGYKQLFLHAKSITIPDEKGTFLVESAMPESWSHCLNTAI